MFLAVHEFFKGKHAQDEKNIKMYYLNVGKNKFSLVFPTEQKDCVECYDCNLKEYLAAYSIEPHKLSRDPLIEFNRTKKFYSDIFEQRKDTINVLHKALNKHKHKHEKLPKELENNKDVLNLFKETFGDADYSWEKAKYLTGGWFEEYVYFLIRRGLGLKEDEVYLNLNIKDKRDPEKEVPNEIDIIFIYKNKINIIECKTGLRDEKGKSILSDVLYKQSTLRKNFGLTTGSFLFLSKHLEGNKEQKNRAKVYSIEIIDDREMLLDEDRFKNEFLSRFK